MTSQIVIMTKICRLLAAKKSRARYKIVSELISTVLACLLLVEFRKIIEKCTANLFWRQTFVLVLYLQKNLVHLWDFGRFSLILQRKILNFKSYSKCRQPTQDRHKLFRRRSSAFGKRENKFGGNVPSAPLNSTYNLDFKKIRSKISFVEREPSLFSPTFIAVTIWKTHPPL